MTKRFRLRLGGGNEKNIFRIFFPPFCLGVLTEGMESSFPYLGV